MADGDLCTVDDIINESLMTDKEATPLLNQIAWKITDISMYLKSDEVAGNPNLSSTNPDGSWSNAHEGCKFGVLEWLESHGYVRKTEKIVEQREGKVIQKFSEAEPDYLSYSEQYSKYKRLLMGPPTVGAQVHVPNLPTQGEPGPWWPP